MAFNPLSDEQLFDLQTRFEQICVHTAKAPAKPSWAPKDAPAPEPPFQVVFRVPARKEWGTFRKQATTENLKAFAQENLAKATIVAVVTRTSSIVHDGKNRTDVVEAFDKLLDRWPAIPEAVAEMIGAMIGAGENESEKG